MTEHPCHATPIDGASSDFTYDVRNLPSTQTDKASGTDTSSQTTQFTQYTPDGLLQTEIKPNGNQPNPGNTIAYTYFADGLLQHQKETTPAGTTVDEHTYTYTSNGDKNADTEKLMNADPNAPDLTHTLGYSYDPRDRITKVTKDTVTSELYTRDASDNVTAQTIGTTPTSFKYDRDRLLTATSGGATVSYNYDPFGRLDTVTDPAGTLETNIYDGFDNITSHQQRNAAGSMDTTRYTYNPLNRITSQAVNGATPTSYAYLGLTGDLTSETTTTGTVNKSYAYTPAGQRLYQYTPSQAGNTTSPGYYSYNDHNDTEAVTGSSGTTTATYGYTAYGQPDPGQFTGQDKNNTQPSASSAPFNSYRLTPCAGTLPPASTTCGSGTTPPP